MCHLVIQFPVMLSNLDNGCQGLQLLRGCVHWGKGYTCVWAPLSFIWDAQYRDGTSGTNLKMAHIKSSSTVLEEGFTPQCLSACLHTKFLPATPISVLGILNGHGAEGAHTYTYNLSPNVHSP